MLPIFWHSAWVFHNKSEKWRMKNEWYCERSQGSSYSWAEILVRKPQFKLFLLGYPHRRQDPRSYFSNRNPYLHMYLSTFHQRYVPYINHSFEMWDSVLDEVSMCFINFPLFFRIISYKCHGKWKDREMKKCPLSYLKTLYFIYSLP